MRGWFIWDNVLSILSICRVLWRIFNEERHPNVAPWRPRGLQMVPGGSGEDGLESGELVEIGEGPPAGKNTSNGENTVLKPLDCKIA